MESYSVGLDVNILGLIECTCGIYDYWIINIRKCAA